MRQLTSPLPASLSQGLCSPSPQAGVTSEECRGRKKSPSVSCYYISTWSSETREVWGERAGHSQSPVTGSPPASLEQITCSLGTVSSLISKGKSA
jgi:hypothetical protein